MAKGFKSGGRQPGSKNRRTIAAIVDASQQVGAIKRQGHKKATEILNDLMQTAMSFAATYQQKILAAQQPGPDGKAGEPRRDDVDLFWVAMNAAGAFAKSLAPYQDPTFKAVVHMAYPVPGASGALPPAPTGADVVTIDDPVALARVYQQTVKRVA